MQLHPGNPSLPHLEGRLTNRHAASHSSCCDLQAQVAARPLIFVLASLRDLLVMNYSGVNLSVPGLAECQAGTPQNAVLRTTTATMASLNNCRASLNPLRWSEAPVF